MWKNYNWSSSYFENLHTWSFGCETAYPQRALWRQNSLRLLLEISRSLRFTPSWNPRSSAYFHCQFSPGSSLQSATRLDLHFSHWLRHKEGFPQGSLLFILFLSCKLMASSVFCLRTNRTFLHRCMLTTSQTESVHAIVPLLKKRCKLLSITLTMGSVEWHKLFVYHVCFCRFQYQAWHLSGSNLENGWWSH